jgi:hypothetical protein
MKQGLKMKQGRNGTLVHFTYIYKIAAKKEQVQQHERVVVEEEEKTGISGA